MRLLGQQKTTLKTHMSLNTNTTPAVAADGTVLPTPFVINTRLNTNDPNNELAIAEWYNLPAQAGDNQAFPNRQVWQPRVTIQQLNTAIRWQTPPVGADEPTKTNSWLLWQTMIWNMTIDMTDPQVRQGVLQVWGDVAAPSSANGIGAVGQQIGLRVELALAAGVTGAATNAWAAAHPPATLADGTVLAGRGNLLTQPDVHDVLVNG